MNQAIFIHAGNRPSLPVDRDPPAAARPATPANSGHDIMRLQRQVSKRLVPLTHAHGQPIVKPHPPAELVKAWRKAKKKRARAGLVTA